MKNISLIKSASAFPYKQSLKERLHNSPVLLLVRRIIVDYNRSSCCVYKRNSLGTVLPDPVLLLLLLRLLLNWRWRWFPWNTFVILQLLLQDHNRWWIWFVIAKKSIGSSKDFAVHILRGNLFCTRNCVWGWTECSEQNSSAFLPEIRQSLDTTKVTNRV